MNIGEGIKKVRKGLGLSQIDMAGMIGVSPQYLSNYEIGAKEPPIHRIDEIAGILGVSPLHFYIQALEQQDIAQGRNLNITKKAVSLLVNNMI